jgi:hypothetical protein
MGSGAASFILEEKTTVEKESGTETRFAEVSPDFFETFGVRLLGGRSFSESDDLSSSRVTIVNQSFVDRYMPGENPWADGFGCWASDLKSSSGRSSALAPDLAMNRRRPGTGFVDEIRRASTCRWLRAPHPSSESLFVRTGRPMSLPQLIRAEIEDIAPGQPVYDINRLDRAIEDQNVYYRLISEGFLLLGVSALLLASSACMESCRLPSIAGGGRSGSVAMGADAGNVRGMILRQGLLQLCIGIALGLTLAVTFAGMLEVTLFEVKPWDPFVFATVILVLFLFGMTACIIPARRATRVDPIEVLREE